MESISINVFVKEEKKKKTTNAAQLNIHMRERARHFVSGLEKILHKKEKVGNVHFHDWPIPQDDGTILVHENDGNYCHLENPKFDADIAVCVIPSIEWADGVVGKLWLRDRKLLHLCLLSAKPLPEYDEQPELYRGLLALPASDIKDEGGIIYLPATERKEKEGIVVPTAVSTRHMTIDSFDQLNAKKLENIVNLVEFQKK